MPVKLNASKIKSQTFHKDLELIFGNSAISNSQLVTFSAKACEDPCFPRSHLCCEVAGSTESKYFLASFHLILILLPWILQLRFAPCRMTTEGRSCNFVQDERCGADPATSRGR